MTDEQKQEILELNEVGTFFLIDECGAFLWRMGHTMSKGFYEPKQMIEIEKDMINVRETQQFAVDNLLRFGIDPLEIDDKENGNYWKWYHFWDDWKSDLSHKDWQTVFNAIESGEDYSDLLPLTKWNDKWE